MKKVSILLSFFFGLFLMSPVCFSQETKSDSVKNNPSSQTQVKPQKLPKDKTVVKDNKANPANTQATTKNDSKATGKVATKTQGNGNSANEKAINSQGRALIQSMVTPSNRDRFTASLKPDQVNILNNLGTSTDDKKKALTASLSAEQRLMVKDETEQTKTIGKANK